MQKCDGIAARKIHFGGGVVGLKDHAGKTKTLQCELPARVYLWVNFYKRVENYYSLGEAASLQAIDPLFRFNNQRHESLKRECRIGQSVISADGDGVMRRCHFVKAPIGNIYEPGWEEALRPRLCPNETCGCHSGYMHMKTLGLYDVFGNSVLERIPTRPLTDS